MCTCGGIGIQRSQSVNRTRQIPSTKPCRTCFHMVWLSRFCRFLFWVDCDPKNCGFSATISHENRIAITNQQSLQLCSCGTCPAPPVHIPVYVCVSLGVSYAVVPRRGCNNCATARPRSSSRQRYVFKHEPGAATPYRPTAPSRGQRLCTSLQTQGRTPRRAGG